MRLWSGRLTAQRSKLRFAEHKLLIPTLLIELKADDVPSLLQALATSAASTGSDAVIDSPAITSPPWISRA